MILTIKKYISKLSNLNTISQYVMLFGAILSIALLVVAFIQFSLNIQGFYSDYTTNTLITTTVKTATVVFAEAIIGAICIDFYSVRYSS